MNIKVLSILLVLFIVSNNFIKKENLDDDFMKEASGGLLNKDKSSPFKKNTPQNNANLKDPNSASFDSDIDALIKNKSDGRAVVVDKDTSDLDVNKEADVEQRIGGEEDEGNGCNDVLLFGLVLLMIIYIVYYQINEYKPLKMA